MSSKTLYIIRGVPGSGKSTLAHQLTKNVVETDDFMMVDGEYKYDKDKVYACHKKCFNKVLDYMAHNVSPIAVANTFIKKKDYKPYVDLAKEFGYDVEIKVCKGDYKNIHNVPQDRVEQMKSKFQESINSLLEMNGDVGITEAIENKKQSNINDNFWKWFGNSKCVDENGNPKVFIHRSNAKFNAFDKSKIGQRDHGWYGKGFYFGSAKQKHYQLYGKHVYKCFLRIENPFYYNEFFGSYHPDDYQKIIGYDKLGILTPQESKFLKKYLEVYEHFDSNVKLKKVPQKVKGYNGKTYDSFYWVVQYNDKITKTDPEYNPDYNTEDYAKEMFWMEHYEKHIEKIKEINRNCYKTRMDKFSDTVRKMGYDGIIHADEYVVFEPNQIKSVKNNGNWSLNSDNINEEKEVIEEMEILRQKFKQKLNIKESANYSTNMTWEEFVEKVGRENEFDGSVVILKHNTSIVIRQSGTILIRIGKNPFKKAYSNLKTFDEIYNMLVEKGFVEEQILTEEVNQHSLYHGCDLAYAVSMMIENAMRGETIANINGKKYQGNSLTRSLQFAKDWQEERWDGYGDELNQFWVVLELNKERLKTKYKVLPYNYWEDYFGKDYEHTVDRNGYGDQYEEFVVGRINNLRNYLDDVYLSDECFDVEYAELFSIVKRELELRGENYTDSQIDKALQILGIDKPSPNDLNKTKIDESIDYDDEWNTSDTMYLNDTDVVEKNKLPQTFWNWFGNSKIKDNNGNPIICYHTSNVDFDMFKRNPKDNPTGGVAYFFTNSLEAAEHWMDNDPNQMIYDCFLKIENPMYIDGTQDFTTLESRNNLLIKAKSEGYDGAIIRHTDIGLPHYTDEYIVFYSRQIKLIDNVKFGNNRKINENYKKLSDDSGIVEVFSYNDIKGFLNRCSFGARGLLNKKDGSVYLDFVEESIHSDMVNELQSSGIDIDQDNIIRFLVYNDYMKSMDSEYAEELKFGTRGIQFLTNNDIYVLIKNYHYNETLNKLLKLDTMDDVDVVTLSNWENNGFETLNEAHSYYINNVKLYENPSIQWMKKKLNSGTELRILIDGDLREPYFGDWIVWDATEANHQKVLNSLNLYEEDYISVRLCKDSIVYWGYTKEQIDKLQECEIIQKLYPNGYELIGEW